jgi:hypothetical protein
VAKTQGSGTLLKSSVPKPPIASSPRPPSVKKGTYVASASNQLFIDQLVDDMKKGVDYKDVLVDPKNLDKRLRISIGLDAK